MTTGIDPGTNLFSAVSTYIITLSFDPKNEVTFCRTLSVPFSSLNLAGSVSALNYPAELLLNWPTVSIDRENGFVSTVSWIHNFLMDFNLSQ